MYLTGLNIGVTFYLTKIKRWGNLFDLNGNLPDLI